MALDRVAVRQVNSGVACGVAKGAKPAGKVNGKIWGWARAGTEKARGARWAWWAFGYRKPRGPRQRSPVWRGMALRGECPGGMDGIELQAYGHLMDQFISPLTAAESTARSARKMTGRRSPAGTTSQGERTASVAGTMNSSRGPADMIRRASV